MTLPPSIAAAAAEVRDALGDDPDEIARWDSLCAISDADILVQRLLDDIEEADGDIAKLDAQLETRKARKTATVRRRDARRSLLLSVMDGLGVDRIKLPEVTVSRQQGRLSLRLAPDFACPTQLRKPGEPDTAAIRRAVEAGEHIEGATLERGGPSVTIRRT